MRRINVPEETKKLFDISQDGMKEFIEAFHSEMKKGLCGKKSSLKMIPSFVRRPKGSEKGRFLALDLGGTNFRVLEVDLLGDRKVGKPIVEKYALREEHIRGEGAALFDFIAGCIEGFLGKHNIDAKDKVDIGFTFSFPVDQTDIASGTLLRWTKGFSAGGVEGQDVVKLMNEALLKKGLKFTKVVALANDTVGTFVAKNYKDPDCDMGVILGTGTNACYPETITSIIKWAGNKITIGDMIINIEWGNFNKIHKNRYDRELDASSENPGEQILEKMISGMYLGEIVRLVIVDFIREKLFFEKAGTFFQKKGSFKTEHMSLAASDNTKLLSKIKNLLKEIGIPVSDVRDRKFLKDICDLVSGRAASLSAAAIAAVITKIDPALSRKHTVAVDGTVYERYPGFSKKITNTLGGYLGNKSGKIKLVLAKDGSGTGAGIIAAVALSGGQ